MTIKYRNVCFYIQTKIISFFQYQYNMFTLNYFKLFVNLKFHVKNTYSFLKNNLKYSLNSWIHILIYSLLHCAQFNLIQYIYTHTHT